MENFDFCNYLEGRDWGWKQLDDGTINVSWTTPYFGEFNMDLDVESPISDFMFQAEGFDVDEYVKLWLGNCGLGARKLVEDAEAIEGELNAICLDLSTVK